MEKHHFRRAMRFHRCHMKLAKKIQDQRSLSDALNGIGSIYRLSGQYDKAIKYLKLAKKLAKTANDKLSEAKASWNLGLAYIENGHKKRAIILMRILVDYETRIDHPDSDKNSQILKDFE